MTFLNIKTPCADKFGFCSVGCGEEEVTKGGTVAETVDEAVDTFAGDTGDACKADK